MMRNSGVPAVLRGPRCLGYRLFSKYRSFLMGLQIVLVMFFHVANACRRYDIRFSGFVQTFYTYIGSSGVDLFLLLSGVGLYYSWKRDSDSKQFYRKRFVRLFVPYFLIAIPAWIIRYYLAGSGSLSAFFSDLFFLSFFTSGTRWFWYILMAAICYAIFPTVFKVFETARDDVEDVMRAIVLSLFATQVLLLLKLYDTDLYDSLRLVVSRFPAFFAGLVVGKWSYHDKRISMLRVGALLVLSIFSTCFLNLAETEILGVYARALLNYSICFVLIILIDTPFRKVSVATRIVRGINRFFSWLGGYTLELYMTHVAIQTFLEQVGRPIYRISSVAILVVLSVISSLVIARITRELIRVLSIKTEVSFGNHS